jgi:hypothetical protein
MNNFKEFTKLMMEFANVAPKSSLIKLLKEACSDYEKEPTKRHFKKVCMIASLIQIKDLSEDHGMQNVEKDFDSFQELQQILKSPIN